MFITRIKELWKKYNPFDIGVHIRALQCSLDDVSCRLSKMDKTLEKEIITLRTDLNLYKTMLHTIGETIPDMMWFKGTDGKYLYANKAIKEKLLFDMNPIGKTDFMMAQQAKKLFGEDNHTFGEKCANSDLIVLECLAPRRFLESGRIKGKMVYLEVFKAPLYIDGILVGVCGTGRDLTEYIEAYNGCCCNEKDLDGTISGIFSKYHFE